MGTREVLNCLYCSIEHWRDWLLELPHSIRISFHCLLLPSFIHQIYKRSINWSITCSLVQIMLLPVALKMQNIALEQISQLAAPECDTMQRIAAYFTETLADRILKAWPWSSQSLQFH
jgi:hypothetical protein